LARDDYRARSLPSRSDGAYRIRRGKKFGREGRVFGLGGLPDPSPLVDPSPMVNYRHCCGIYFRHCYGISGQGLPVPMINFRHCYGISGPLVYLSLLIKRPGLGVTKA
jgi:hypothetical protein